MVKKLIFDFDGTLADSDRIAWESIIQVSKKLYGSSITYEQYRKLTITEQQEILKVTDLQKHVKLVTGLMLERSDEIVLFEFWNDLLSELAKRYELHIVSSGRAKVIANVLGEKQSLFASIIADVPIYEKKDILQSFKDGIYVGDEVRDIVGAHEANMPIIAVTWGHDTVEKLRLAKPNFLVSTKDEFIHVLEKL